MNKQLRKLLVVLEASALSMVLLTACTTPTKTDYNPLSGQFKVKILCLDEKTGKLIECSPQTEEEMNCHGMDGENDPSNPKKEM